MKAKTTLYWNLCQVFKKVDRLKYGRKNNLLNDSYPDNKNQNKN